MIPSATEIRKEQRISFREREIARMLRSRGQSKVKSMKYTCIGQPLGKKIVQKLEDGGYKLSMKFQQRKCPDYGNMLKCYDYIIRW
jgi:hypothetical protein